MEKKVYSKPCYIAEKFDLAQSITVQCYQGRPSGSYANHWTPSTCAWLEGGTHSVFLEENTACVDDHEYTNPEQYDEGCYHSQQGTPIFSS